MTDADIPKLDETQALKILLRHHGYVFRQARRFMILPDLTEDVVQQVFIELLKTPDRWQMEKDLRPLLLVLTRRTAQKIWKDQAKYLPSDIRKLSERLRLEFAKAEENFPETSDQIDALRHCIPMLSDRGRKLVTDYYFDGVSLETLSKQLHKKTNVIAQALYRLREKLRSCIDTVTQKEQRHA